MYSEKACIIAVEVKEIVVTNLSVFELLLNMFDDVTTIQALEGPLKQLRSNLTGSGHHSSY